MAETESQIVNRLQQRWPKLLRWVEVPGSTRIILLGSVQDSLAYLPEMAQHAVQRHNRPGLLIRVEFHFLVSEG